MTIKQRVSGFITSLLLTLTATTLQAAVNFEQADRLFAEREGDATKVSAARAEYLRLLSQATGHEVAYIVQQVGMLANYEALYLLPSEDNRENNQAKARLFDQCRDLADRLEGQAAEITIYVYWRMSCTSLWMQYAPAIARLAQIERIKVLFNNLIDANLEPKSTLNIDARYQGGGLYRVLAAIYSNQLASLIRDDLPNGAKAIEMADRSLRTRAFPNDMNAGADYYRNYHHKADALLFLRRNSDAAATLSAAIEEIEERGSNDELPVAIEPETKGELVLMRAMQDNM